MLSQECSQILNMSPIELLEWLNNNYNKSIPISIESSEELKMAGGLLGELANIYSFLMSLIMLAKLRVRESKRINANKNEINDNIDKRDILNAYADIIKTQYNAISRMITVRKQVEEELKML